MAKDKDEKKEENKIPSPLQYLRDMARIEYVRHQPQHKKEKGK